MNILALDLRLRYFLALELRRAWLQRGPDPDIMMRSYKGFRPGKFAKK
jgi:hypothetical protein